MTSEKKCIICGKKFRPNPRSVNHQKACNSQDCRNERKKRACREWRKNQAERLSEESLREKVRNLFNKKKGNIKSIDEVLKDNLGVSVIIDEYMTITNKCKNNRFCGGTCDRKSSVVIEKQ